MAVAHVSEFDVESGDRSTPIYDEVSRRLGITGDPPAGLIAHTAGFTDDDVFRIFDVWASREEADRFYDERLAPVLKEVIDAQGTEGAPPPRQYYYDLHDLARP